MTNARRFAIGPGDLNDPRVISLLHYHLEQMHLNSPAGSVFALDLSGLRQPGITFLAAYDGDNLAGVGALKEFAPGHAEIKSMRTARRYLRKGVARSILERIIEIAYERSYIRLSLETGSGDVFDPALALYREYGFTSGLAFADYKQSAFNQFFHRDLK